jgi:hypothetical protein
VSLKSYRVDKLAASTWTQGPVRADASSPSMRMGCVGEDASTHPRGWITFARTATPDFPSMRTTIPVRVDGVTHPRGRVLMDGEGFLENYIRGLQTLHSHFLHRLCLENSQCLLHCMVWAAIRESYFVYTCCCWVGNCGSCYIAKPISKFLQLRP